MSKVKVEIVAGLPGKTVTISKGKDGKLRFNVVFQLFEEREVYSIEWNQQSTRNAGKAVGYGIAAGLATGGIGALIGAAVGGRRREASTAVLDTDKGQVIIKCDPKQFTTLQSLTR